jgi:carboxypeptidase Taq
MTISSPPSAALTSPSTTSAYRALEALFGRASAFREAQGILSWDMQTMMPLGASEARGAIMAALESQAHEITSSREVALLIAEAEGDSALDPWQKANLREMRREHLHAAAVDPKLVTRLIEAGTRCNTVWREARPRNDFAAFAPELSTVIGIVREVAAQKAAALGCKPYDALIDQYEPGMTAERIETIFTPLRSDLPGLAEAVFASEAAKPAALPLEGPFDPERQKALGLKVMELLGFDFNRGRLDRSAHPFCGGASDDIRITTRYRENEFVSSLMGIIHETGHALYEQALPRAYRGQPVGRARGMAVHESQSLFHEMQLARSDEFLSLIAPLVRETFGGAGPAWEVANLKRHVLRVKRGLIRVDADEVTYPTHILLRFQLEQELLDGSLAVNDLPGRWKELMRQFVGVEPSDDKDGCMQDIHWTDGSLGYFPSYTLGALIAAQLMQALDRQDPGIRSKIAAGQLGAVRAWLGANVHGKGSLLTSDGLVREATGEPISASAFLAHLKRRYLA